jgi:cytochrome c553
MNEATKGLTAKGLADVAAYYASQPRFTTAAPRPKAAEPFVEPDPFADARELTADCAGCHGEDGNSDLPGTPSLAGQNPEYLVTALKAYRDGARSDDMMASFVEGMSDADFETIAFFYASSEPRRAETELVGDPFAGQAPSADCAGCHGSDGNAKDTAMPRLAGLDSEYLATAITAYKSGDRESSAMQDAVGSLRDDQIRNIAAFYASNVPTAPQIWRPRTTAEWVERCNRCHGPGGRSQDPRFPILAGQQEAYLVKALKLYHGAERPNALMQAMSFTMSRTDIKKLAAYYARQGGK